MSADILTDTNKNSNSIYEDDNHYLNIDTQIGKGSFAKVYKGYYHTVNNNDSKQLVAIKVIDSSLLNSSNKKQQQILTNNLEIEITILKKLIHKNIVKLITTIVVNETKQFIIVMEYCNLGDLSMLIRINKNINNYKTNSSSFISYQNLLSNFPKNKYNGLNHILTYSFIKQLASALKFIRSKNLIHRDIKPQNLLLSTANSDTTPPILKIADFGFARFLPSQSMAETLCGSPQWMAPEILSYKKYDEKVDLWSSGAVIYEMCFGKPAYSARNYMELLKKIKTIPLSFPNPSQSSEINDAKHKSHKEEDDDEESSSDEEEEEDDDDDSDSVGNKKTHTNNYEILNKEMKNLIKGLLTYDPEKRMTFEEFFKDPIVTINLNNISELESQKKEIQYHDVFYDDSDEEENETEDKKMDRKDSFQEADGYLMIDNAAIKTASEYPINERRKSSASSRRSSFAGMTRAITKAFRSASQTSATSTAATNPLSTTPGNKNMSTINSNENSPLGGSFKLKNNRKLSEQLTLTSSQFYDLTVILPQRLSNEDISSSASSFKCLVEEKSLEREQAKMHILQKILKQEDLPEWRLQLEIRLLDHISKMMVSNKSIKKDAYMQKSFDRLVIAADVDYQKLKADQQHTNNSDTNNLETGNVVCETDDKEEGNSKKNISLEANLDADASDFAAGKEDDLLWPDDAIVDLLWQHVSKFGRISLQLERAGQMGAACMGYASILWLLDYILFDLKRNSDNELDGDKEKFLRMVKLTVGRLKGIY